MEATATGLLDTGEEQQWPPANYVMNLVSQVWLN